MPRLTGLDAPGILHHVIGRGIERKDIFYISLGELCFGSRRRDVVEARASIGPPIPQFKK
jgi:hypothetical protein